MNWNPPWTALPYRRTVAWALDRGFVADARRASLRPDPSLPAY